jgi:DNA-nicking Smr family endonuclease
LSQRNPNYFTPFWQAPACLRNIHHVAKNNTPNDDKDLFRQMVADVKPLSTKKSAPKYAAPFKSKPAPQQPPGGTRNAASTGFVPREHVPDVTAEESLFFARPGLQQRLLRRFKRGELRPEARLDLHGCTIAEAAHLLAHFLHNAQHAGQRCVYVIHGKGHRSAAGRPALKAQVNQWLRDAPAVLAFCSTQAKDGGMGALYVLLKRLA